MGGFGGWLRGLVGARGASAPLSALPQASKQPSPPESFADDGNDFALAMYGQIRQKPGNLFFSPFSLRTALCMAQAGARCETAEQMQDALGMSSSDEVQQSAFGETIRRLNASGGGRYEVAVANSLWGQEGAPLEQEYLDRIARHYGGAMELVDFRRAAEAARAALNRWVEDRTRQKIRELIPSGALDGMTRLVLVNAIYFKGRWVLPFPEEATREEPFRLEGGGTAQAPLMHQRGEMRYLQAAGYQAVEVLYRGRDLSMLVLLPDQEDGLRDLERGLSARMLRDCVAQMAFREVELFLPRFEITWGTVMRDELVALGMPLAFDPSQADFSGINGRKAPDDDSLFISAVFHEAFVDVREEGTEAAAATAIDVEMTMALGPSKPEPVPVFRADHPFLFAIRDRPSGAILFLGRVADPTRET